MKTLYILFKSKSCPEWEKAEGKTLDDAIAQARLNDRWRDYGRDGAIIIEGERVYEISVEVRERLHEWRRVG